MAKIGYARVSTRSQNDDSQVDDLTAYGCDKIFTDTASSKNAARPELDKALAYLREDDVFVITRLSRAMRSLKHLLALAEELRGRGVGLVVLSQQIDTTTPTGRLVFHVLGAIDEFQRELIIEGTREGLAAARARGRTGGRKPKLSAARPPPSGACTRPPDRMARGSTPSPRSPRPPACTAPPCTTTSTRRADHGRRPAGCAPARRAGRPPRAAPPQHRHRRGDRAACRRCRPGRAPARRALPATTPAPARRRQRAAVLTNPSAAGLTAATFRIGLIMERGLMGRGSALALTTPARGAGMDVAMMPGMALEDVWI